MSFTDGTCALIFFFQPVTLLSDIKDQTTQVDKEAVFECKIKINYPEITLSWYKDTQKLETSHKYEVKITGDHHFLKIKNCQKSDQGNYRIVCGPHISSAKLSVLGKSSLRYLFCILFTVFEVY